MFPPDYYSDLPPDIYIHNLWKQEIYCIGKDGRSLIYFSHFSYDDWVRSTTDLSDRTHHEYSVVLTGGQFLLVTTQNNRDYTCCRCGYRRITLDVLDKGPDLESSDYPQIEPCYQDSLEYEIYTYEEALEMI